LILRRIELNYKLHYPVSWVCQLSTRTTAGSYCLRAGTALPFGQGGEFGASGNPCRHSIRKLALIIEKAAWLEPSGAALLNQRKMP